VHPAITIRSDVNREMFFLFQLNKNFSEFFPEASSLSSLPF
jgi:hypothetical protein